MTKTRTTPDALTDWAAKTPERTFLTQPFEGEIRQWTFRQAHDDAARLASALLGLGLAPGDKVAILSKNCAEWMIADVAISMAGLLFALGSDQSKLLYSTEKLSKLRVPGPLNCVFWHELGG